MRGTIREFKSTGTTIPHINIEVELAIDRDESVRIFGYSMKLFLCNVPIGDITKFGIIYLDSQRTKTIRGEFNINPYIFKMIENQRHGGDVPVNIQIQGLSITNPKSDGTGSLVGGNFRDVYVSFDNNFKLSQRDWIEKVSDMGYANYKIFEISYNTLPEISDFERIFVRLEEAQTLFLEGKNKEVVTACRQAFEALRELITINDNFGDMKSGIADIIDKDSVEKEGEDPKSKKMLVSTSKIYSLLHTGPHDPYDVTREDAEHILLLSISTVRYYVTQFNKFDANS